MKPPLSPQEARKLSRELTRVANVVDPARLPAELARFSACWRIGFTGPPGAGKSSLVGRVAATRGAGRRVGVVAIDPSSPLTGGAILGDRVRMDGIDGIENVFVRSVAARSSTDGLADNLPDLLDLFAAHDFDEVIVETVGVGQPEVAGRSHVDTLVLVLPPDAGDVIQGMKAGILEVADIVVVNKSDLPGARRMATNVAESIPHPVGDPPWTVPVLLTSQDDPASIAALCADIERHQQWLEARADRAERLLARERHRTQRVLERLIRAALDSRDADFFSLPMSRQIAETCSGLARTFDDAVNMARHPDGTTEPAHRGHSK